MKAKERIEKLEAELAAVREELEMVERCEGLERELAELRRRIAGKRPTFPAVRNGWYCGCGAWVTHNSYHACTLWQNPWPGYIPIITSSGTGQLSSVDINSSTIHPSQLTSNVHSIVGGGLLRMRGEDPPDMGVPAVV